MKVVVIGANAAGAKAAAKAKRCNPETEVTVFDRGDVVSYAACGFPYHISDTVPEMSALVKTAAGVTRDITYFRNVKEIEVITETEVVAIDRERREISLYEKKTGSTYKKGYDRLIIATGSSAALPPLENLCCPNIVTLKSINDAKTLKAKATTGKPACIVGGGLIGLETAEALQLKGLAVTIVEMRDHLLPDIMDRDMALLLELHLKKQGINILTSSTVVGFDGSTKVERAITTRGEVPGELVVLAPGVIPNVTLAEECGLAIGSTGGIAVDADMRTSDPNIFACGDCCETIHLVTGQQIYHPLGSTAIKQGRVAGINAAGGKATFNGILGTTIVKVLGFTAGKTGLNESEAAQAGLDYETVLASATDKAHFFPGAEHLVLKLIAERKSGRVLGAQVAGLGAADKRLDAAAVAITYNATVDQLAQVDLAYAPPFSPASDILHIAADIMKNKLTGVAKGISPLAVKRMLENVEAFVLLDVRTSEEYAEGVIPGAIRIPLGLLRQNLISLPKDKKIIAFCKISLRGYEAQKLLENSGFTDCAFMEGGITAWPFELEQAS